MAVPVPWVDLTSDEKRERTLSAADDLFAREGLDVAMPVLAAAVGVGVGSIYRQVGAKDDVIATLVIQRAGTLTRRFSEAARHPDAWAALSEATYATVQECVSDFLSQTAWDDAAATRPEVAEARAAATSALEELVERARAQGALRPDAEAEDLRLVFKATRELATLGSGGARRLAELVLRGMAAEPAS